MTRITGPIVPGMIKKPGKAHVRFHGIEETQSFKFTSYQWDGVGLTLYLQNDCFDQLTHIPTSAFLFAITEFKQP